MLIVDASCLYDVVSHGSFAHQIEARLDADPALAAPHVIDVEVLSIIRRDHLRGLLDGTAAQLATEELRDWPGERFSHRPLLDRAWELRHNVRAWDAFYVALAEALDATLITRDRRLGRVHGLRCDIEVVR
jgi:predicted nucleic acid-binding protein